MKKFKLSRRFSGVYYIVKIERYGVTLDDRLEDAFNRASDPGRERIVAIDDLDRGEKEFGV